MKPFSTWWLARTSSSIEAIRRHFHERFYLSRYSDVRKSGMPAWDHYRRHGLIEDRQPRGDFDPVYYRSKHRNELGESSPFEHWVLIGRAKGYLGHPWIDDPEMDDVALMSQWFDAAYYRSKNEDVVSGDGDLFEHFLSFGWKENRDPAPSFSFRDYLQMNPELRATRVNPFSHYVVIGRGKGLLPAYPAAEKNPLRKEPLSDIGEFLYDIVEEELDRDFYLSQFPDGTDAPIDCVLHYIREGALQGLDPNSSFSTSGYLTNNPDVRTSGINPLFHFICQGRDEGRTHRVEESIQPTRFVGSGSVSAHAAATMFSEHLAFTSPGPDFEALDSGIVRSRRPRAKLIAYYLPQFHAIPENDAWWGPGFTEWRNIVRGQPRFSGHQQPRVPEQLGFYDLTNAGVMQRQVELAKSAGIHGFCFYYYNFNGKRILEKPIEAFLADRSVDFPFALLWANENWTRTWDGFDRSVLLKQDYRREDEAMLLADFARHFKDPRYIRIDGRPLLFIYRPGQIPDAKARFEDWRAVWEIEHGERPLFFMAQGFDDIDPTVYGLDGAIEFPPHKVCKDMQPLNPGLEIFDPTFSGHVISYAETVERAINEPAPNFPLIKTAVPSWDNEARRPGRGMTLHGSNPAQYERWLRSLVNFSEAHPVYGDRFVAVNAWNEWAEGAYLEPDVYHGAAYLNATARALTGAPARTALERHSILIVGHDAYRHGAQLLVRNLAEVFKQKFGFDVHLAICGEGPLLEDYRLLSESCSTIRRRDTADGQDLAERLMSEGVNRALVNTTVSGWLVPILKDAGFAVTSLVHELPQLIREYGLEPEADQIGQRADSIVFPAPLVRDEFLSLSGPMNGHVITRPQGLYRDDIVAASPARREKLRARFRIPAMAKVVINVGFADMRKGFDVFLRTARAACAAWHDVYFIWVGSGTQDAERWQMSDIAGSGLEDRIRLTGYTESVVDYYAIADAFFLTSREDPFPSVVLEAFAACLPVIAVRGLCGTNELVEKFGSLVDIHDERAHLAAFEAAFRAPERKKTALAALVQNDFKFDDYCFDLVQTVYPGLPKVSVVVPNYNYARYLDARLTSIFRQTHPVFEVIVLDDLSSDDSLNVISSVAVAAERKIDMVINQANSGSVFRQWRKGVERARGDYIWIAEADDDCEETFLQELLGRMVRDGTSLGFCDSAQVGSDGERLGDSYRSYVGEETGAFDASFRQSGREFVARHLSIKNVILNVSSVIFRRDALLSAIDKVGDELFEYRVAGDWRLYVEICGQADSAVSYEVKALNIHRRHQSSVTHSLNNRKHFSEIQDMQRRAALIGGPVADALVGARADYLEKVAKYLGISSSSNGTQPSVTQ